MMLKNKLAAAALLCLAAFPARGAAPRFEKVSDHCAVLQFPAEERNICAVTSAGGVLLIDPPAEPDLSGVLEALRRISSAPVRWVVYTDVPRARTAASAPPVQAGALILAGDEQFKAMQAAVRKPGPPPALVFPRLITLFPDNVEVRILAAPGPARTSGDLCVLVPAEKVLVTGELFSPGALPEIETGEDKGSALGWIDGLRQMIEAVPLLKSAMPTPKPDPAKPPPEEKSLEELITVVPGRGARSNLMEMKSLLESAQKMRAEGGKAAGLKRSKENFLSQASLAAHRGLPGFESFAGFMYDELLAARNK